MAAEATMTANGSKRGARALSVALLIALGTYLADRVMLFTTPPPAVPGATATPALTPAYDRQRLLQTALFGTAAGPSAAGPVMNAPETRLALTLHGLFSGSSESSALISAAGGQPRRYLGGASASAPGSGSANAFSPRSALRAFQGALAEQGESALASYGLAPASGGAGLEINNQVPAAALAQVGLRPGDRILSVNGQGVDGLAQNPQQIDAVLASGSARLEIQRGQRTFFVTAPIPE